MEKETSQRPKEKKKNYQLRFVINVLASAICFVSDLYVMINMPENIPALVIVTILFLATIYLTVDTSLKNSQEKKSQSDEIYENILKSEKASYLLLKKSFGEVSELLEMTDVKSEGATEEIINAQKALAKVIISREKENADAIMNSNDNVVEKVTFMESTIADLKPSILQEQQEIIKAANDEIVLKHEKLFIELNNMEASMKDGLNEVSTKLSGFQEEIEKMADTLATMVASIAEQAAAASNKEIQPPVVDTASSVQAAPSDEVISVETTVPTEDTVSMEQPVISEAVPTVDVQPTVESVSEVTPMPEMESATQEAPVMAEVSNITGESAASIVDSIMSAGMTGGDDEIKLEEILSIDDIVNSITAEASSMDANVQSAEVASSEGDNENIIASIDSDVDLDNIEGLDSDISLDGIEGLDSDISLDNIEGLDTDISLDRIESLDSNISLDSDLDLEEIESLDDDINVDNIEGLDTDISLDSIEGLDSNISLDSIEDLDSDISLDSIGNLDSGINLDSVLDLEGIESLDDDINVDNIEGLDIDISLDSIEGLDSNISLDGIENLDSGINLDSVLDLEGIESLDDDINVDNIEGLDSNISLDSIEGLDSDISLDSLNTDINLDNIEGLDTDFNITEDTSLDDILKLADEPVVEEKPIAADTNPNKILTPEEIAALVAGASEPEKEEIVEEISIEEEKPSMPDLSNPNKIMTPEEIAALLANM